MDARRPPPNPDTRRPAGANRPCTAPPAQLLVEGSGAGGSRHDPAHPQGRAVIDPPALIVLVARGSGVMETAAGLSRPYPSQLANLRLRGLQKLFAEVSYEVIAILVRDELG